MVKEIQGYYDGNQVVIDQADRQYLRMGDMLTINITKNVTIPPDDLSVRKKPDFSKYGKPTARGQNVEEYMKEIRENDLSL